MSDKNNQADYLDDQVNVDSKPSLGALPPRRGNVVTKMIAGAVLALFGWRLSGRFPDSDKLVVVGAPHTSNWDWVLVMLTAFALGVRISWMAKHTLFKRPWGGVMRFLGGIPIDRRAPRGVVGETIDAFKQGQKLILCITPEGTRTKVREWKTGFYRIALGANVPIVLASFDYGRKVIGFGPTIQPSGDLEADLSLIQSLYAKVTGRHPHKY